LSRIDWQLDRNNRRSDFSYDINDNLLTEAWAGTPQLQYTYDKVGNLKSSYDAGSNTTNVYNYDAIYQLTDKITGNTKFHYDYDVYGDLIKREDWLNSSKIATLDYTYDKNHQLKHLVQTGTTVAAQDIGFSYDKFNQLTNITRQTGNSTGKLVTDYQYTAAGLLEDINNHGDKTNPNSVTNISHYHYGYDAGNRLILTTGTDGSSAVDYGKDNQLKSVVKGNGANESYSFDALGIRTNWSTVTGDSRQVLNDGKYEYKYDDEGNLSQKKELLTGNLTNYTWDYRNRLTKVTSGAQTVEYLYDAEDKRVGKKINGVVTEKYIYDGADIALVVDGAGVLVERYLFGDGTDNVLSREKGGAVVWSLGDRQGSVVDLVDGNGTVLNHFVYDSFGGRTGTTGVDFRFGYTGRELDTETGLYYYRARYYDPGVGRFISEDPIGFGAGDTNLYRYVNNSPTNFTDPSGEIAFLPVLGMLAMGAMNALIDVNVQLAVNNMTDKTDMNWASVGVSFGTGVLGFGLAQKATQVNSLAWKIAANPLAQRAVDSGIAGVGKVAENTINGHAWNNDLAETVAGNFILGTVADAGIKGAGKAVRRLDQFGGNAVNWLRNPVHQVQESFDGGVMTMSGGSKWRLNPWDESADPLSEHFMAMAGNLNTWRQQNIWPELPTSSLTHPTITANDLGVSLRELDLNNGQTWEQAYTLGLKTKAVYNRIQSKNMRTVLAGVSYADVENNINITKFAQNDENYLDSFIHSVFQNRVKNYENLAPNLGITNRNLLGQGIPGTHAEVIAASKVLRRIEMMNPGLKITSKNADKYLSKMMVYNVGLKESGSFPGMSMARCTNCQVITADIRSLSDVHPVALQQFGLK
jgi:RHS repeat-associated protein